MTAGARATLNGLAVASPRGRWLLAATVLATFVVFLDVTVVNIALPAIDADLAAGFSGLQWVVNAFLLTLSAFLLLGGSLGDRFGRRRVFLAGLGAFSGASLLCATAPNIGLLVAARAVQGLGGALLVPSSLAIIASAFAAEQRALAIGIWSGWTGVAGALGPLVGGWLVDAVSWRAVFALGPPLALVAAALSLRALPGGGARPRRRRVDLLGAVVCAAGLSGLVVGLIEGPARGAGDPLVLASTVAGLAALVLFVLVERRAADPMLPLGLFASPQFSAANVVTFAVYAGLGGVLFFLVLQLQETAGWSALAAGAAFLPFTLLLLTFSARTGRLTNRVGPRLPLTLGPLVAAGGLLILAALGADGEPSARGYLTTVLPGVLVFGIGQTLTVAPVTAAALGAVAASDAGIGSGVNNAVARLARLLGVAVLPLVAGIAGSGEGLAEGFPRAMLACAGLYAVGALVAFALLRRPGEALGSGSRDGWQMVQRQGTSAHGNLGSTASDPSRAP